MEEKAGFTETRTISMKDRFGREIDYLRISITDRCNLRCVYCMPENGIAQIPHKEILTYDEITRICRCMTGLGVHKIKLTGGEPLTRKGCATLVAMLKNLNGIEKVTLTTNGILLGEQMTGLAAAGIDDINISLDTLDAASFAKVTRRENLNQVLEGIEAVLQYPQIGLKINCVPVLEGPENLVSVAGLAKKYPLHVRFIEMMPIGYGREFQFRGEEEICQILEKVYGTMTPVKERYGNGPCHYYRIEGFQGKIGFISAMTHKFCDQCNRVRMTAEGFLKACLQYQTGTDLKGLMRSGCTDEELTEAIRKVIWEKPVSHHFTSKEVDEDEARLMSQIGG